jgi:DNA-binding FadR family transcriptional regulator
LQLRARARVGTSLQEHARILEAIIAGNAAEAADAMRTHVAIQNDQYTDLIATLQRQKADSTL